MHDVGLLGGTFDPPHATHVAMARAALASGLVDEVLVVPAGDPWQKSPGTAAAHRLAMTQLAFEGEPDCRVLDIEVQREGATYAIDTVRALASPDLRLRYIIGGDTLALLPTWHGIDALVQLCEFLVVDRPGSPLQPPQLPGLRCAAVPTEQSFDASTSLRSEIATTGQCPAAIEPRVWEYITAHGLYGLRHD